MRAYLLILCLISLVFADNQWNPKAEALSYSSILRNHDKPNHAEAHKKNFDGVSLAYVTPWNNRGYDVVKEFKGKFDYVSPVWYYIQRRSPSQFDFDGEHDVDVSWMKEVKDGVTNKGKIVPRFQLRGWTSDDLRMFVESNDESKILAHKVKEQVSKYGFDGVVIECGYPAYFQRFLAELADELHKEDRELIVVLPSIMNAKHRKYMGPDLFGSMANYVDYFSLMSYDYSSHDPNGGPSAPIEWIMDNVEYLTNENNKHKLLIGLNLYAMSYLQTRSPEPLVMKTIIEKLQQSQDSVDELTLDGPKDQSLVWESDSLEGWFMDVDEYGIKQGKVWVPNLRSIRNRLRLAEDYNVGGVALWEVGQGLDYFYDLL